MKHQISEICEKFRIFGDVLEYKEILSGNVNNTYIVSIRENDGNIKPYMLQRVNEYVFRNPVAVMDNIEKITAYMRMNFPSHKILHFHHTLDGKNYVINNGLWRLCNYIPSLSFDNCNDSEIVKNAGTAFGSFQMMLNRFDVNELSYTIPDFHNTRKRFDILAEDMENVTDVREEFDWLMSVKDRACFITDMYNEGELPLRVTHNDTKINNVLFDTKSRKAITVIDLDTVMPGLVGHDFGDAVRSAANFVAEDCADLSKAGINLSVFEAFTDGFLSETISVLTENELETLAESCFCITTELAARFLDDFICGNNYFKINYPSHNLDRARCQIALAKDMLSKMNQMKTIVKKYEQKYR